MREQCATCLEPSLTTFAGWTYFEAMYFCFIFFTTIGYGDYSPKSSYVWWNPRSLCVS